MSDAQSIEANMASYASSTKDIVDQTTEGGEQITFTSNSDVVLIKQTFFGETGKSEVTYYLKNKKVFLINKTNTLYIVPLSEDTSGVAKSVDKKEFYLGSDQALCSWALNGQMQSNDADTQELIRYLINTIN